MRWQQIVKVNYWTWIISILFKVPHQTNCRPLSVWERLIRVIFQINVFFFFRFRFKVVYTYVVKTRIDAEHILPVTKIYFFQRNTKQTSFKKEKKETMKFEIALIKSSVKFARKLSRQIEIINHMNKHKKSKIHINPTRVKSIQ